MNISEFIDRKDLSDRLDGDMDLLKELIHLFIEDSPKLLLEIDKALEENNFEKLRKAAHTIKGSVSNFSANNAFSLASNLENIAKEKNADKAHDVNKILKIEINNVIESLKSIQREDSIH
jgi:two-component system, sensor histidine kinase and response regulator